LFLAFAQWHRSYHFREFLPVGAWEGAPAGSAVAALGLRPNRAENSEH